MRCKIDRRVVWEFEKEVEGIKLNLVYCRVHARVLGRMMLMQDNLDFIQPVPRLRVVRRGYIRLLTRVPQVSWY